MKDYEYHFNAAEDCLSAASDQLGDHDYLIARAHVHALLANASANHQQAVADSRTADAETRLSGCVSEANRLQVAGRPV